MTEIKHEICHRKRQSVGICAVPLLKNLVSDAPHNDARMISVSSDHIPQINLMPLVEETRIIVRGLATAPHVESLVHNHKAHCVAHIQQLRCRRIVSASDSVTPHILQHLKLAMKSHVVDGCAQASQIVMKTYAVYLHVLSVKEKAFVGCELYVSDSVRSFVTVNKEAVNLNLGKQSVHICIVEIPEMRIGYIERVYDVGVRISSRRNYRS